VRLVIFRGAVKTKEFHNIYIWLSLSVAKSFVVVVGAGLSVPACRCGPVIKKATYRCRYMMAFEILISACYMECANGGGTGRVSGVVSVEENQGHESKKEGLSSRLCICMGNRSHSILWDC
jgi:hypothetical protein